MARMLNYYPKHERKAHQSLMALRDKAHTLLDPLWQSGRMTRTEAYKMIAKILDIPPPIEVHIATLNESELKKLITVLQNGTYAIADGKWKRWSNWGVKQQEKFHPTHAAR